MIVLYSGRTIARNIDWKNDFTLFTADVKVSSTSAKSNTSAGGKLGEEAEKLKKIQQKEFKSIDQLKGYLEDSTFLRNSDINEIIGNGNLKEALNQNIDKKVDEFYKLSIHYLEEAVKIHPTYADALLLLGNAYFQYNKDIDKSFEYYKRILKRNPMYEKVYTNMLIITANYDNLQHKIEMLEELNSINPNRYDLNYRLGLLYGENKIDLKKALNYLEKAITIKPDSFEAYKALGAGYGELGDFEKSIQYSSKASQLKPNDQQLKINLGITYKFYGAKIFNEQHDYKKALEYFLEGVKLLPNDPQLLQNIGLTYQQLGNMQKANEYYSKIKNLQTQPTTSN
ncbi:MAG: hypothetical protein C0594_04285 [Marinilabiliales bacterium]|nr:MAG: hypothetical protein C0594_04285 [Marinilabiliales bacterium]